MLGGRYGSVKHNLLLSRKPKVKRQRCQAPGVGRGMARRFVVDGQVTLDYQTDSRHEIAKKESLESGR